MAERTRRLRRPCALAATLEEAGIKRLATFKRKDFEAFPFLEIVEP
jgi:predicted nucleic acid-binding protein